MLFTFINLCIYSPGHLSIINSIHGPQIYQKVVGEWIYVYYFDAEHTGATSQIIMHRVFCVKERAGD
jgi:hypothetical protein